MDQEKIREGVKLILEGIGEDTEREGLLETPDRIARMYEEIFSGLHDDPARHLKIFHEPEQHNELVIVRDIPLYSVCEHHLLPFIGAAHIAYIPQKGNIIGLSKFARIVDCFARRPQVQERLTAQIADFLFENFGTLRCGGDHRSGAPVHDHAGRTCGGQQNSDLRSAGHHEN